MLSIRSTVFLIISVFFALPAYADFFNGDFETGTSAGFSFETISFGRLISSDVVNYDIVNDGNASLALQMEIGYSSSPVSDFGVRVIQNGYLSAGDMTLTVDLAAQYKYASGQLHNFTVELYFDGVKVQTWRYSGDVGEQQVNHTFTYNRSFAGGAYHEVRIHFLFDDYWDPNGTYYYIDNLSISGVVSNPISPFADETHSDIVTLGFNGEAPNDHSGSRLSISQTADVIAFNSLATNLDQSADTNGYYQAFYYDDATGAIVRLSENSSRQAGNNYSDAPYVSPNGRYLVFASSADNMVADDNNGRKDIFFYDRENPGLELVSVSTAGTQANQNCVYPAVSNDGRWVIFSSYATNLVQGYDPFNYQLFIRDRQTNTTTYLRSKSAGSGYTKASLSADGRFMVFQETANGGFINKIKLYDRQEATLQTVGEVDFPNANPSGYDFYDPQISLDGSTVVYHYSANTLENGKDNRGIGFYNRNTGQSGRIPFYATYYGGASRFTSLYGTSPSVSGDGRFIAFGSEQLSSSEKNEILVYDVFSGQVKVMSTGPNGESLSNDSALNGDTRISSDGRTVVYASYSPDIVPMGFGVMQNIFVTTMAAPDSDSDGISDDSEDANHNGMVDPGETDPNDPDSDDDGYNDGEEVASGSDPLNPASMPESTTITLHKGFNLAAIPVDVTPVPDFNTWLPVLGTSGEIEKAIIYASSADQFNTFIPGSVNPIHHLNGGEGLIIYATVEKTIEFTSILCSSLDLTPGFNLVGVACPGEGYSAFGLLTALGNQNAISIQRYDATTGKFESAAFDAHGQPAGANFPIIAGEGYVVNMRNAVSSFEAPKEIK